MDRHYGSGDFYSLFPDSVACGSGTSLFNPVVLSEIVLPTNQSYKFTYNVYGEIDKIVYPSGGYERYRYDHIPAADWMRGIYAQTNRGVVERWTSPKGDGSDESQHHWTYSASNGPKVLQGPQPPQQGAQPPRLLTKLQLSQAIAFLHEPRKRHGHLSL
jgi:hypothetical protein